MFNPNPDPTDAAPVPERRHVEWRAHHMRWRFLLDSFEGGDSYRNAVYGTDTRGLPIHNLIRHKREYPDQREQGASTYAYPGTVNPLGTDPAYASTDDDYQLRWARTPVPAIVPEAVHTHLSPVYAREVKRESPNPALTAWWEDVDGRGTTVDQWMQETIAPLLMVFGCLDLVFDHPKAPDGAEVATRADQLTLNLDSCVADYVLPENMVWWKLDGSGRYTECLVCELQDDGSKWHRHWTAEASTLYDDKGKAQAPLPNPFGRVPIVRVFDRKRPRCRHVGLPRYEVLAEIQREYYNRDSELILSDTTQAHPLLQGPEDYVQADGTVQVGPNWLLPKKKNSNGGSATYEGFECVTFPKDGAESIRKNLEGLRGRADRAAMLTKPAGASGTDGNSVSQSGVSKRLDQSKGNDLLADIAARLEKAERTAAEFALLVLTDGKGDENALSATEIGYPRSFDLLSPEETAAGVQGFQDSLDRAGDCPRTEGELLRRLVRQLLPGLDDDVYAAMDAEIDGHLEARAGDKAAAREAALQMTLAPEPPAAAPADGGPAADVPLPDDTSQPSDDPAPGAA